MSEPPLASWPNRYGGHLVFARVCPKCNRFVKAMKTLEYVETFDGIYTFETNGICKKHGQILMPFIGDL